MIHVDAPVALEHGQPVAMLTPDDVLFGEMTCMSHYPRSATVTAAEDCTVLEILRNVLYMLQRNKASKRVLDDLYRRRSLESHLRSVPIFSGVLGDSAEFGRFADFLRGRVQLIRVHPGQVIFRQGDRADHFYMVRVGFVKVSQSRVGGEHVLNYIGPGGYFGEIGLLAHLPEIQAQTPPGIRTATCSALDHVDLVRVSGDDFRALLAEFPRVLGELSRTAVERLEANQEAQMQIEHVPLAEFLEPGAGERPELAGARSGKMHPLRRMHQGLRRFARRRHPADPRGLAVRQIPGGQFLPLVSGSLLHGRLPGRLDPPPQQPGDRHRGLVHRLRQMRRELPLRQHQHARLSDRRTGPGP